MSETGGIAAKKLRSLVDRIERLEEEKAALTADVKEVYAEAKALGFETKVLRKIIALRKQDPHERREQEELLDLYLQAIDQGEFDLSDGQNRGPVPPANSVEDETRPAA